MTEGEVRGLCLKSREIFLSQPILLELEAPLKICGEQRSIGMFPRLSPIVVKVISMVNTPIFFVSSNTVDFHLSRIISSSVIMSIVANNLSKRYVYYLPTRLERDKGWSCGIYDAVLDKISGEFLSPAWKSWMCFNQSNLWILRWMYDDVDRHRTAFVDERCLFLGKRRYNIKLWKTFTDCFNCLPIAAIIDEKIFCCHGGSVSPRSPIDANHLYRSISRSSNHGTNSTHYASNRCTGYR